MYTGKDYNELKIENELLKEQLERMHRENIRLAGMDRRSKNSTIHKLEHEKDLAEKHKVNIKSDRKEGYEKLKGKHDSGKNGTSQNIADSVNRGRSTKR